jgi:micrococcal nuclease
MDLYNYEAKVTNVVDGDTCDLEISLGFYLRATHRIRLLGVNSPEMHGPGHAAGLAAKEFATSALLGKNVVIHTEKSDVFGRWLAVVYLDGDNFNERLLREGFAVPYRTAGHSLRA